MSQRAIAPKLRPAQIERMRIVIDEELEAVWANRKPAKEALDNAVARTQSLTSSGARAPAKRGGGRK